MSEQNPSTSTNETPVEKAPPKEIIRGRMPVAVVALARFQHKDDATKALADSFGTTVGKIDDIKKNRNFAYVTADFKPTDAQVADGVAWLKRHPTGADALIAELEALPRASEAEAAAFEATRSAARGQSPTTKEGETADAGGGNRKGGKKKDKAPAATGEGASGDALLA